MKLLTTENAKTPKGETKGYLTGILYLAPASLSGVNLCPWSTTGCRKACLNTAGRGQFNSIQDARLIKTLHFLNNRAGFIDQLRDDIKALERKAEREGLIPIVRLNGTSDIIWERIAPELFIEFSHIQFYDYTKFPIYARGTIPANYKLTYSNHESMQLDELKMLLDSQRNVATVFETVPKTYLGYQVINGDESDLRFLDPQGVIVGLTAKGKAKKDTTGFVVRS
jgi:hypothetical protein